MVERKQVFAIAGIFFLVLAVRLLFTLTVPNFSSDASYSALSQVNGIINTGHPSSYYILGGEKLTASPPMFYYIISLFASFMPLSLAGKLIPQIFASSLAVIIYFLSFHITKHRKISYINAFIGGTLPIFLKITVNSVSDYSLSVPLFFLALYFLLNITRGNKYIYLFLITLIFLMFTSYLAFVLILSLIIYLVIIRAAGIKSDAVETETILFSSFMVFWFMIIILKNVFLAHGYSAIWQNTPSQILELYFSEVGLIGTIYAIGIIPILAGIFVVYRYLVNSQKKPIYLFSSVIIVSFILMWFRLMKSIDALSVLGISLVVMSSQSYLDLKTYFFNMKMPLKKTIMVFLIALLIIFSMIPSFFYLNQAYSESFSNKEMTALIWLKDNTPEDSVIASLYNEGHAVEYISGRKVLLHQNFLLFNDPDARLFAHNQILSSNFATNAIREASKYGVDYVYFSPRSKEYFDERKIPYTEDSCFEKVYDDGIRIYKIRCVI